MSFSNMVTPAIVLNVVSAVLYAVAANYAQKWAELAAYVYLGSAVVYLAAVIAKVHAERRYQNGVRDTSILRIQKPGRYRLTREFVALASDPVKFLEVGLIFHVTEVAADDFVVYIPEFGGWTYCEIPAERVKDVPAIPAEASC